MPSCSRIAPAGCAKVTAIAIFRTRTAEQAVEGVGAAVRGGFEAVEITMDTPDATDAMAELAGRTDSILGGRDDP